MSLQNNVISPWRRLERKKGYCRALRFFLQKKKHWIFSVSFLVFICLPDYERSRFSTYLREMEKYVRPKYLSRNSCLQPHLRRTFDVSWLTALIFYFTIVTKRKTFPMTMISRSSCKSARNFLAEKRWKTKNTL